MSAIDGQLMDRIFLRLPPTVRKYAPYAFVSRRLLALPLFGEKYWDANNDEHMAMLAPGLLARQVW